MNIISCSNKNNVKNVIFLVNLLEIYDCIYYITIKLSFV